MVSYTKHAELRMAQWNLHPKDVIYVMQHGRYFRRAGVLIAYLRRCDIPVEDMPQDSSLRLAGTAVVLSKCGQRVVTVWRDEKKGLKHIKRKPKYLLNQEQLKWAY